MKRLLVVITLALLLVVSIEAVSSAGSKIIEPEQFTVYASNTKPYFLDPEALYANSQSTGAVEFYSNVKLPVGKTIKGLILYYYGYSYSGSSSPYASVSLIRRKIGFVPEYIASADSNDEVTEITPVVSLFVNPLFKKIKKGYKYWVKVYSKNWNSIIYGVKITYN